MIWLIIKIVIGFKQNATAIEEYLPATYIITSENSTLFAEKYFDKIEIIKVNNSKVRNPISIFLFNKKYHIVTYKINLLKDESLQKIIHTKEKSVDVTLGYSYNTIGKDIVYQLKYKAGTTKPVTDIYFSMAGNSLQQVVNNDSIISYHLSCKNISVKYGDKEPVDLLIVGEEKPFGQTSVIPLEILFLKRNQNIYLLIMTPKNENDAIQSDLLYQLIR